MWYNYTSIQQPTVFCTKLEEECILIPLWSNSYCDLICILHDSSTRSPCALVSIYIKSTCVHVYLYIQCPNTTVDNKGCMLVFGGFPSADTRQDPSIELWVFDGSSENWTRLADAVSPLPIGRSAQ